MTIPQNPFSYRAPQAMRVTIVFFPRVESVSYAELVFEHVVRHSVEDGFVNLTTANGAIHSFNVRTVAETLAVPQPPPSPGSPTAEQVPTVASPKFMG